MALNGLTLKNDDSTTVGTLLKHDITSPATGIVTATALVTVNSGTATDVGSSNPLPITIGGGDLPDTSAGDLAAINAALGGTLTVGSHAVTNAGTFAVQVDGDALTALQLLDDAVYTDGSGTPSKGLAVMGTDGTNPQIISTDTAGHVQVDVLSVTGTVTVDGSGVTQPVSAASLPLPSGAATAANQSTGNTSLSTIAGAVSGSEMQVDIVTGAVTVQGEDAENAAATASPVQVGGRYDATPRTLGDGDAGAFALDADGAVHISDGGNTITVDGTVAATQSGNWSARLQDGGGTAITSATRGSEQALTVQLVDASGNQITSFGGSGGTSATDDSAFTAASGSGTPFMAFVTSDTVDAGDVGVVGMDTSRNLKVSIEVDNAGIGGGTQYTEGATDATITGTAILWEDSGNALSTVNASSPLPIGDAGGAITVDAANDGSLNVTIGDGSNTATIRNLASNDALNVSIVDGSGNQVTSFGGSGGTSATDDSTFTAASGSGTPIMGFATSDTVDAGDTGVLAMDTSRNLKVSIEADNAGIGGGTQYTEDAAAPANPVGNAMMAERDDALGGLTPAEGDWSHLYCDANGALWVNHNGTVTVDNGGTFAVQDSTVATNTTDIPNVIGTDGAAGPSKTVSVGGTESGGNLQEVRVDADGHLQVDVLSGGGSGTEYSEDVATPATIVGTATMMERDDALSAVTPIEGDWIGLRGSANGALWVAVDGTVTVDGSGVTQPVSGTVTANLSATDNAVLDQIEVNTSYGDSVGGGTEAAALRVTIANDSTGVLTVDDGGGSLTIDASSLPLPTGAATATNQSTANSLLSTIDTSAGNIDTATTDIPNVIGTDGSLGPSKVVSVGGTESGGAIQEMRVDADGHLQVDVLSGASSTEYTEDAAAPANPDGTAVALVRADTPGAIASADGDWVSQRATDYGAAYVQLVSSSGSFIDSLGGGTEYTEDAAPPANPVGKATMLVRADTPTSVASANGDWVAQRATDYGAAFVVEVDKNGDYVEPLAYTDATVVTGAKAPPTAWLEDVSSSDYVRHVTQTKPMPVALYPSNSDGAGATAYKLISAATTNATSVVASSTSLHGIQVYNTNASARYLKLYNKASAPTVGTDTPVKVITIPGNTAGAGSNITFPTAVSFGTGLAFALTTGAADSDTGAVAANEIVVNLDYHNNT